MAWAIWKSELTITFLSWRFLCVIPYHLMEMGIPIFRQVMVTIVVAENDTPIWLQIERSNPAILAPQLLWLSTKSWTRLTSPRRLIPACATKNTSKKKERNQIADEWLSHKVGVSQTDERRNCSWQNNLSKTQTLMEERWLFMTRNKMCHLRKTINYHKNTIPPPLSPWQNPTQNP